MVIELGGDEGKSGKIGSGGGLKRRSDWLMNINIVQLTVNGRGGQGVRG